MRIYITATRTITESKEIVVDVPDDVGKQLLDERFAAAAEMWAEQQVMMRQNQAWNRGLTTPTEIRFSEGHGGAEVKG